MKVKKAEFVKSARHPEQYPPPIHPEIAFAGRSNVGKSSLINTLLNRKKLVKTSKTPGHTQLINFFNVDDKLSLVDLPGYGFAKVPDDVKDSWGPMIETYLSSRQNLRGLVCIMDVRRGLQEDDLQLIEAAPLFGVQPILVFTKADKLSKQKRKNRQREIADQFGVRPSDIIIFSSLKNIGVRDVWRRIEELTGVGK